MATLTLHSCRATLLNATALRGAEHTTLMLPDMPAKYIRDRKAIPLAFLRKMAVEFGADENVPELLQLESEAGSEHLGIPDAFDRSDDEDFEGKFHSPGKASDHRAIEKSWSTWQTSRMPQLGPLVASWRSRAPNTWGPRGQEGGSSAHIACIRSWSGCVGHAAPRRPQERRLLSETRILFWRTKNLIP